jgi:hypothetical protein
MAMTRPKSWLRAIAEFTLIAVALAVVGVLVPRATQPWHFAFGFAVFWLALYPRAKRILIDRLRVTPWRYWLGGAMGTATAAIIGIWIR